jgi:hypothetical protein
MHPLLGELLAMLPPDGAAWQRPARKRWIAAVDAVIDVLYEDGPLIPAARERASSRESDNDGFSVLDLRPNPPATGDVRGRHARPSASYD